MGLSVMQAELASSMGYKDAQVLEHKLDSRDEGEELMNLPSDSPALEWFQLAREVRDSASAATNGTLGLS